MLVKMRRRFIAAAMLAFGMVMLVVAAGINIANYYQTARDQDRLIAGIIEYESIRFLQQGSGFPPISEMPWAGGAEAEFTTRFFIVHCDKEGNIMILSRDFISSVDEKTAQEYTQEVLDKGQEGGYFKDYRYFVKWNENGSTAVFLNASNALQFMRSLLAVSVLIGMASLFVVFVLVVMLSRLAILPYAKNMERQKRFITDAGHEIKTPLTSIATEYGENEWIANIQKQTVRLTRLVSDLVALSRLDEEMPFPEKTLFSLSDAAWETAEPFASLAKAGGKTYVQNIEEHLQLEGDRNSIQQLLSILLDNAVKYSGGGGTVRLDIYSRHNKVCIEVYNTCNLEKITDLNRLFDRFYRPDESRAANTGGTGIGLSMAQAITEAHGGRISVASRDGKSILFKVIL